MDVNIMRFWFALKANFTDVRPSTRKTRQECFLTNGSFFGAPPPTNVKDSASAEGASEEKLAIYGKYPCPAVPCIPQDKGMVAPTPNSSWRRSLPNGNLPPQPDFWGRLPNFGNPHPQTRF